MMEKVNVIIAGLDKTEKETRVAERLLQIGEGREAEAIDSVERQMVMEYLKAKYSNKKSPINIKTHNFKFEVILNSKVLGYDKTDEIEEAYEDEFEDDPKNMEQSIEQLNWFLERVM